MRQGALLNRCVQAEGGQHEPGGQPASVKGALENCPASQDRNLWKMRGRSPGRRQRTMSCGDRWIHPALQLRIYQDWPWWVKSDDWPGAAVARPSDQRRFPGSRIRSADSLVCGMLKSGLAD